MALTSKLCEDAAHCRILDFFVRNFLVAVREKGKQNRSCAMPIEVITVDGCGEKTAPQAENATIGEFS